jgi:cell division protein FtsQ
VIEGGHVETVLDPRASRWRRWPWVVIGLALSVIVAVGHSALLAVETIEITGASRSDTQERVAASGLGAGALLLYVNTGEIERAVLDDPWVLDVRVERIWPDSVAIEVLEHDPLVWIEGVTAWMLVARDGTVLELSVEPTVGLMRAGVAFPDRVPGEQPIDPAWTELVEMARVLADDIGGTLELELRGPELWTVAFDHEVRIGHPIDLADKARTMRAILSGEVPDGAIIDVSSPIRPAIVPLDPQDGVESLEGET